MILVVLLGVATSACSSGPSAAAAALCGTVVASPAPNVLIAVSDQTIEAGERSGYPDLDRDATNWWNAIADHRVAAGLTAQRQIVTDCDALRIPLGTATAP
jgi:hypothetical protein